MDNIYKIITPFIFTLVFTIFANSCFAKGSIPTPPKRPDILNVSPSYIEELKNKYRPKKQEDYKENIEKNIENVEIIDITDPKDLANILEESEPIKTPKEKTVEKNLPKVAMPNIYIPIPKQKPFLHNIEPASGEGINNNNNNETTLISFALEPQQIELDKNLKEFLITKTIKLFNEKTNLKMEIYTYATPIKGETHSEVRISLARALKIRSFLINNKVAPHRLKLSPMGNKGNKEVVDRVDLVFIEE